MRFLSNTYDPSKLEARVFIVRYGDETQQQAWENHLYWLSGKIIGDPQATETYTVQQLKDMNMVGVYLPD